MTKHKKFQILRIKQEISLEDALSIRNIIRDEHLNVILDVKETTHINLSGIPVFECCKENIKFVGLSNYLQHIFVLAGYENKFSLYDTELDALKSLES